MTNIRIARRRAGLKPEVYGEWIVDLETDAGKDRMAYICKVLTEILIDEPDLGWGIETRGTERGWHEMENNG